MPRAVTSDRTASAESAVLDEGAARRVLLVRACETESVPDALWSQEDRAWATRLTNDTAGPAAPPARWLAERARHACERLLPRDATLAALARRPTWRPRVVLGVAVIGLLLGLLADSLGGGQQVDLLAPPLLAVLVWNLVVYALLAIQAARSSTSASAHGLRRLLARLLARRQSGPLRSFAADWALRSAPVTAARVAVLLHVGAATLALGLVAALYLRGLVLDFRAGWQSTFLGPEAVHALLATVLAPASALTGIALPDAAGVAALQVGPGRAATGSAAPWIHLFAATLALFVVAPRALLALGAALQAWRRARRFEIPLAEPYFQRLLVAARRRQARVEVLPHGAPPSSQAVLGLRAVLAETFGEDVALHIAAPVRYGEEDPGALPAPDPGATLVVALFDLAVTPEPETQGRLVDALRERAGAPLVLLADESAFRRRFATLPQRVAERRAAWQAFAEAHGLGFVAIELDEPDLAAALRAFEAALALPR